jgi:hypothetical protein
MSLKVFTFFLVALLSQNIECVTRVRLDIQNQYNPTLLRLKDLANIKAQEALRTFDTLDAQLKANQVRTKNATQTQINKIKDIIATAKKSSNVTTIVLGCLKVQETAASRLSTSSLNGCYTNENITALKTSRGRFGTLANVASNTPYYCTNLNPLETQNESYAKCLAEKIPDLNRQINIVETEYQELSNSTLHFNLNCLTDKAGTILSQIGVISFDINVCFFTPL